MAFERAIDGVLKSPLSPQRMVQKVFVLFS